MRHSSAPPQRKSTASTSRPQSRRSAVAAAAAVPAAAAAVAEENKADRKSRDELQRLVSISTAAAEGVSGALFQRLAQQWLHDREEAEAQLQALRQQLNESAQQRESAAQTMQQRTKAAVAAREEMAALYSAAEEKLQRLQRERDSLLRELDEGADANSTLTKENARLDRLVRFYRQQQLQAPQLALQQQHQASSPAPTQPADQAGTSLAEEGARRRKLEEDLAAARTTIAGLHTAILEAHEQVARLEAEKLSEGQLAEPPTGRVAVAFTDVQGSTALWEKDAEAMRRALEVHFAVLRESLSRVGGYEVKSEGDSFFAAFQTGAQAVRWCCISQEALLSAEWPLSLLGASKITKEARAPDGTLLFRGLRVRMGAHIGEPFAIPDHLTRRMDYFGRPINKAARIAGLAQGGQIVISNDLWKDVADDISSSCQVVLLGEFQLKGIAGTERVFQVSTATLSGRRFEVTRQPDAFEAAAEFFPSSASLVQDPLSATALLNAEKTFIELRNCATDHNEAVQFLDTLVKKLKQKAFDQIEELQHSADELIRLKQAMEQLLGNQDFESGATSATTADEEKVALLKECLRLRQKVYSSQQELQEVRSAVEHLQNERSHLLRRINGELTEAAASADVPKLTQPRVEVSSPPVLHPLPPPPQTLLSSSSADQPEPPEQPQAPSTTTDQQLAEARAELERVRAECKLLRQQVAEHSETKKPPATPHRKASAGVARDSRLPPPLDLQQQQSQSLRTPSPISPTAAGDTSSRHPRQGRPSSAWGTPITKIQLDGPGQ